MFGRLANFVYEHKYLVVLFWVLLVYLIVSIAPSLNDLTTSQSESFIPNSEESIRAREIAAEKFTNVGESSGIVIFEKQRSFNTADLSLIRSLSSWIDDNKEMLFVSEVTSGANVTGLISDDDKALLMVIGFTGDQQDKNVVDSVGKIQDHMDATLGEANFKALMIGGAAIGKEMDKQFEISQQRSEFVTMFLVLGTLFFVYRALPAMILPLMVIGIGVMITNGVVALLVENFGLKVSQMTPMMIILVLLGAGTNYCLFLVSRYKEELLKGKDVKESLRVSLVHSGEAIASSALTVIIAFAGMAFAQLTMFKTSGPAVAIGVSLTLLAALTLLPAILSIFGKAFFWPTKLVMQEEIDHRASPIWKFIGRQVITKPYLLLIIGTIVLLPTALYSLNINTTTDLTKLMLPPESQSLQALNAMDRHFSKGESSKISVLILGEGLDQGRKLSAIKSLTDDLENQQFVDEVASITQIPIDPRTQDMGDLPGDVLSFFSGPEGLTERSLANMTDALDSMRDQFVSDDKSAARIEITTIIDPMSDEASAFVADLRSRIPAFVEGTALENNEILIGGGPAESLDLMSVVDSDFLPIAATVLGGIFVVLIILLRSLISPIYLILTVVLTYYTTLGATVILFEEILNVGKIDFMLPIFTFVFIVALGEDFNIFLMSRMKEEIAKYGHEQGIYRAVALTGGVISSAGIIMAGALGSFALSPMLTLMEMGFAIGFGILLDTFIIRPILVPSIAFYLGDANWWPWGKPKLDS